MQTIDHNLAPLHTTTAAAPVARSPRLVDAVAFIVGFVTLISLLEPPYPEDDILRAKRDYFAAHASEFDGVFFGSSRIHRAFDPATFAAVTGESGEPIRVFNFGLLYGRPHEMDTLIEETLRAHRAKYVFVEVMDFAPSLNADLADQDRTIRWHTPRQTASAIRTTWRAKGTPLEKVWRTGQHAGHWLKRSVHFGGGITWLKSWFDDDTDHRAWTDAIATNDGWIRYEQETDPRYPLERRAFLEKYIDDFRRQVATVDATNRQPGSLDDFNTPALREQQAMIRRHGAEPIYIVPNVRQGTPGWHRLDDEGHVDTLFTFNHVARYPDLYTTDHHFDRRHLNTPGARVFTRHLAARFNAWRGTTEYTE